MYTNEENKLAVFANGGLRFSGVAQLSRTLGTDLIFVELSATAPLKAEQFGIVEAAIFRARADGRGQAFTTLVNPECDFDDMASKALGLSTKDVINDSPWGLALGPFFDKALLEGSCVISVDSSEWTIPALLRAQARYGFNVPDAPYSCDIRELIKGLVPQLDGTGTIHHLARQFGVQPYRGIEPCVASVFAQVEIVNALVCHCGPEAVADVMAGVAA